MNERIAEREKSWSKDLKPLLGVVVSYKDAAKRVGGWVDVWRHSRASSGAGN